MLESTYLCWRLEARQFLEHPFWKASACDLRPRKFSSCVLGSECVCVCVGIVGLGKFGSRLRVLESNALCWRLQA